MGGIFRKMRVDGIRWDEEKPLVTVHDVTSYEKYHFRLKGKDELKITKDNKDTNIGNGDIVSLIFDGEINNWFIHKVKEIKILTDEPEPAKVDSATLNEPDIRVKISDLLPIISIIPKNILLANITEDELMEELRLRLKK